MFTGFFTSLWGKFKSLFNRKPIKQPGVIETRPAIIQTASLPVWVEPDRVLPTKAYADQRQKAPHNRRRKPSKAMRNLYKLGA